MAGLIFAGLRDHTIAVQGTHHPFGFWMHPPNRGAAQVTFALHKSYRRLSGAVALDDGALGTTVTPPVFRILGDGRVRWESPPVRPGEVHEFTADLTGVDTLQLVVECPGSFAACHAVWIDPKLDE